MDWNDLVKGKRYITDIGEASVANDKVNRYAVWEPDLQPEGRHQVVEVSNDLEMLQKKYKVASEYVFCLQEGARTAFSGLSMEDIPVDFDIEVKDAHSSSSADAEEESHSHRYEHWGFSADISGEVSQKQEQTRSTDKSAKYDIYARAIQQPPSEGLSKLEALFAETTKPIEPSQS